MSDESLDTKFSVHEAVCAKRYEAIERRLDDGSKRMSRIEMLLYITICLLYTSPSPRDS